MLYVKRMSGAGQLWNASENPDGRNWGRSSLADFQLHKDVHDWGKQQKFKSVFLGVTKEDSFPDNNKMYNLPKNNETANRANTWNVQQTAH